jgi:hypothetical protein
MLESDSGFANRVSRFEDRFGPADADTVSVLAQAAYFCWGNSEYRNGIIKVCQAIGAGKPTSFFYHAQITPDRWNMLNTYVMGVQRWLGVDLPVPGRIDGRKIQQIGHWLGEYNPVKNALVELFFHNLISRLLDVSFAKLGGDVLPDDVCYANFTNWYTSSDGIAFNNSSRDNLIEKCRQLIRHEMGSVLTDAEELMAGILQDSPPPCVHRFTRYLDIQITSIGVLKWRGNLPLDSVTKEKWMAFLDEAHDALTAWVNGAFPRGELAFRLHKALGKHTQRNRAIVRGFLLSDDRGAASDWLVRKAREEGTTADDVFIRHNHQGDKK